MRPVARLEPTRLRVLLVDAQTVEWFPGGDVKGTSGVLHVRATANGISDVLTIPVNFR